MTARNVTRHGFGPKWSPVVVGVVCFLVALVTNAVLVHESGLSGDEPYYERMAAHPGGPHNFPYAFRVGLPYLVHVLPFSHAFSWELLALLAAGAAAGAMFALMRELEVETSVAVWLSVCFAVSPPVLVMFLRNGRGVDIAAVLVITLGCLFIVRRQRLALAATLLVGTTIHESCLFLIPLAYAVWAQKLLDVDALRDLALVALVPLAVYLFLRSSIVALGENYQPGYVGPFFTERVDVIRYALQAGGWKVELRRMAIAFGPLWLLAPAALPRLRFARRGLVLVACCVASMTYALDWGRAIFFAAPVFYVSGAYMLRNRRTLATATIVVFLMVDVGYAGYMQLHGVKHDLDSTAPPARGPVY
ncbi:MAG: hypothetical protein WAK93_20705 [Solirubrobacteraceae bacterium]